MTNDDRPAIASVELGFSKQAEERQESINRTVASLRSKGWVAEAPASKVHGSIDDLLQMEAIGQAMLDRAAGKKPRGRLRKRLAALFS